MSIPHEQPNHYPTRTPPAVHRIAAELDGQARVVAGAMSSDARIARESAADWFLERAYTSYHEMAAAEAADANGIDFVIIATPNDLHYPVARAFLRAITPERSRFATSASVSGREDHRMRPPARRRAQYLSRTVQWMLNCRAKDLAHSRNREA